MLTYRPHHFLCTLGFEGKGYSDGFVRNFQEIADRLRAEDGSGDSIEIRVVHKRTDSICAPCPNRSGTSCQGEEKIQKLDHAHARILNLTEGSVLTWGEAKRRIASRMSLEDFHQACASCAWKSLGLCEAALRKLKKAK